jgi:hypothetical protein
VTTDWHRFYKNHCGYFDERFIPEDMYNGIVEYVMNPRRFSLYYQNKSILSQFVDKANRCKTIFNSYDYLFYDEFLQPIQREAVQERIRNIAGKIVIKPAVGSGGGRGVSVHDAAIANDMFADVFKGTNYIVQEFLSEGEDLRRFNPDTVNTIRMLSLNINGSCSVLSAFLRIGAKGMVVDNLSSGGILVGITPDGYLHDYALDKKLNRYTQSPSGIIFKDVHVSSYALAKQYVLERHHNFPLANLIAWDIAIDEHDNIIIIEINLDSGEIQFHQMFNGPLFGERTEEVIQYVSAHHLKRYSFI